MPDGFDGEASTCAGFALNLDGSSYALIPRSVGSDFTLEAWMRTTTSASGISAFSCRPVFDADILGPEANDNFTAGVLNDKYVFGVGNPDITVQGITRVTTGEWVHVAVTRAAGTGEMRIFVNGALDAVAISSKRGPISDPLEISFGGSALLHNFIGAIDEVRIWDVVRSADEIASNMRSRLGGSEAGLVGLYTFEDRGREETRDLSRTAQPAALIGGPTYVPSLALCPPP